MFSYQKGIARIRKSLPIKPMPKTLGSSDSYRRAVPLGEYLSTVGPKPIVSLVRIVFLPGKYLQYALVTEANYSVRIYPNNELFELMEETLKEQPALQVRLDTENIGSWSLEDVSDQWEAFWEFTESWIKIDYKFKKEKKPAPNKNPHSNSHEVKKG